MNHANIHMLSISATSDAERAGAIKKDTWVRAKMGNEWKVARIVEAQIIEGTVAASASNGKKATAGAAKFKYYVTFHDENRRLDRWVQETEVIVDTAKILDELKSREKVANLKKHEETNLFENDEHLGMDKKAMQDHEEATKIKTINMIELGGSVLDTWYFSPFPREFHRDIVYVCDYCLNFFLEKG